MTDLEVDLVSGAGRTSNFVVSRFQLLDGGERLCRLHHREEGGVGGREHVEEDEAGHEHYQEDQPGAPLSRLGLRSLREGKEKMFYKILLSHFLLRNGAEENKDIETIVEGCCL